MKIKYYILSLVVIAVLNVAAHYVLVRVDLTQDKRYTLSEQTKALVHRLDAPVNVQLFLDGDLNSGFAQLKDASKQLLDELNQHGTVEYKQCNAEESGLSKKVRPTEINEKDRNGRMIQTRVYPYAIVEYKGRVQLVNLLRNIQGLSGAENLNMSIEGLEYTFAEAISTLAQDSVPRVAFIEGHGELDERTTYDATLALSKYFQVDRGRLGSEADALDAYKAIIVADPQEKLSEADKYIIDQYVMRGGRVMWLIGGVKLSEDNLAKSGFTPVIPLDVNLTDMLFRYGVRVNPHLVQDVQCLPIAVDASSDPTKPDYQLIPWFYSPLLLASQASPITRDLVQVIATFASDIDLVGNDEKVKKEVLLATSTASTLVGAPSEVDLIGIDADINQFKLAYIPVAVSMEGQFTSVFAHRLRPDSIQTSHKQVNESEQTKQVVVACGSVISNDWQQGMPLPMGYSKEMRVQFGNRDFVVNTVLWLTDDNGLINLRQKSIPMHLLSEKATKEKRGLYQMLSVVLPLVLLALIASTFLIIRKRKYTI